MLSRTAVDQYLDHIGVTLTDAKPTLDDLRAIQRAHACRVPFENLCTVRNHRFVSELGIETGLPALDHEALMQTIVHKQRGGWCVQSNGLLQAVLTALGYELYGVAARVVTGVDSIKPEGDLAAMSERAARGQVGLMGPTHQVILVKGPGDDQWRLVDAAFGGNTPSHLIPLQAPVNDAFHGDMFRVRRGLVGSTTAPTADDLRSKSHALGWYMQRYSRTSGSWQDQYFLVEAESLAADFGSINFVCHMAPQSLFCHDLLMAIHRHDGGRVTVLRDELKVYGADGSVEVRNMKTLEDFKEALALFGIPVPGAQ